MNRIFNKSSDPDKHCLKDYRLEPSEYQKQYKRYVVDVTTDKPLTDDELESKADKVYEFAKKNGASHYTFWAFPQSEGVIEKQDRFLDLKYQYGNSLNTFATVDFNSKTFLKNEGDGSSVPSGGLRSTYQARAYLTWDPKSEIFLRKKSGVLYIPSLLVTPTGEALDDKTLLRNAERVLKDQTIKLLERFGVETQHVYMGLGVEQEMFIIPREASTKRIDIRSTGRAMIGEVPPRNQQFCDHYYGKLPAKFQDIFAEIERELFEIGVPIKTRHKQVSINQFQFVPLFEEVGKAIDHNMILMDTVKQVFEQHGFTVLFHEKPFNKLNGSGKHCNWSLNYIGSDKQPVNLFKVSRDSSQKQTLLFRLFILMSLKALKTNQKLYLSSVSSPGNELRLGGFQAPPRILSASLGEEASNIVDNKPLPEKNNLKYKLPNVQYDIQQEGTDRNRTSSYAFASNRFEFRGVGSSQNVSYPMAVIAATLTQEINSVLQRLEKGDSVGDIIKDLIQNTCDIRFEGDGYSEQWVKQAKKRGLYVNEDFSESLQNMKTEAGVFVNVGVCSKHVVEARYKSSKELYIVTVNTEYRTLQLLLSRYILPRCYDCRRQMTIEGLQQPIKERNESFNRLFVQLVEAEKKISKDMKNEVDLSGAGQRREYINKICEKINEVMGFLAKDPSFPDLEDFMDMY